MYGVVHDSIFSSSLLEGKPPDKIHTAYVFMCMLTIADADDNVEQTRNVLAAMFRVTRQTLDEAIGELECSDPSSRSPSDDGRRIVRLSENRDWGWHIVNRRAYKRLRTSEDRRDYQHEQYEKRKSIGHNNSTVVNSRQHLSTDSTKAGGSSKEAGVKRVVVSSTLFPGLDPQPTSEPCASAMRGGRKRGVTRKSLETKETLPDGEITADQAFDEIFWPEYPRKRDREPARKAWKALKLKDDDEAQIKAIMAALRRDIREEWRDRPPDKIPYGATWLNRKGWLDG